MTLFVLLLLCFSVAAQDRNVATKPETRRVGKQETKSSQELSYILTKFQSNLLSFIKNNVGTSGSKNKEWQTGHKVEENNHNPVRILEDNTSNEKYSKSYVSRFNIVQNSTYSNAKLQSKQNLDARYKSLFIPKLYVNPNRYASSFLEFNTAGNLNIKSPFSKDNNILSVPHINQIKFEKSTSPSLNNRPFLSVSEYNLFRLLKNYFPSIPVANIIQFMKTYNSRFPEHKSSISSKYVTPVSIWSHIDVSGQNLNIKTPFSKENNIVSIPQIEIDKSTSHPSKYSSLLSASEYNLLILLKNYFPSMPLANIIQFIKTYNSRFTEHKSSISSKYVTPVSVWSNIDASGKNLNIKSPFSKTNNILSLPYNNQIKIDKSASHPSDYPLILSPSDHNLCSLLKNYFPSMPLANIIQFLKTKYNTPVSVWPNVESSEQNLNIKAPFSKENNIVSIPQIEIDKSTSHPSKYSSLLSASEYNLLILLKNYFPSMPLANIIKFIKTKYNTPVSVWPNVESSEQNLNIKSPFSKENNIVSIPQIEIDKSTSHPSKYSSLLSASEYNLLILLKNYFPSMPLANVIEFIKTNHNTPVSVWSNVDSTEQNSNIKAPFPKENNILSIPHGNQIEIDKSTSRPSKYPSLLSASEYNLLILLKNYFPSMPLANIIQFIKTKNNTPVSVWPNVDNSEQTLNIKFPFSKENNILSVPQIDKSTSHPSKYSSLLSASEYNLFSLLKNYFPSVPLANIIQFIKTKYNTPVSIWSNLNSSKQNNGLGLSENQIIEMFNKYIQNFHKMQKNIPDYISSPPYFTKLGVSNQQSWKSMIDNCRRRGIYSLKQCLLKYPPIITRPTIDYFLYNNIFPYPSNNPQFFQPNIPLSDSTSTSYYCFPFLLNNTNPHTGFENIDITSIISPLKNYESNQETILSDITLPLQPSDNHFHQSDDSHKVFFHNTLNNEAETINTSNNCRKVLYDMFNQVLELQHLCSNSKLPIQPLGKGTTYEAHYSPVQKECNNEYSPDKSMGNPNHFNTGRLYGLERGGIDGIGDRIIGGRLVLPGELPYQVALYKLDIFVCGSSLITEIYILTAAHCLKGVQPEELWFRVGSHLLRKGGTTYGVANFVVHENFVDGDNDIALVKAATRVLLSRNVQPIALPSPKDPPISQDTPVLASGWGATSLDDGSPPAHSLHKVRLIMTSREKCRDRVMVSAKAITDRQICTVASGRAGTCFGDSGGPLVAKGKLVGIVSWGSPCAIGDPDVYTNVQKFLPWIYSQIRRFNGETDYHQFAPYSPIFTKLDYEKYGPLLYNLY